MRTRLQRCLALFLAVMVVATFKAIADIVPGSEGDIEKAICVAYQACNAVPQCPTGNGECDSCSHLTNDHYRCSVISEYWDCEYWIDDSECGTKIDGICDVNNQCVTTPTLTPCPREDCDSILR